jgi:hypothetical protein
VTSGSGASVCVSVLGVNIGRGSIFGVLGIGQLNPDGSRKVPSASCTQRGPAASEPAQASCGKRTNKRMQLYGALNVSGT